MTTEPSNNDLAVNLWAYIDEGTGMVYAISDKAYALAGVPVPGVRQGCLVSPRGTAFDILANTNLTDTTWQNIGTVTNLSGVVPLFDADAGKHPMRYYRARALTP